MDVDAPKRASARKTAAPTQKCHAPLVTLRKRGAIPVVANTNIVRRKPAISQLVHLVITKSTAPKEILVAASFFKVASQTVSSLGLVGQIGEDGRPVQAVGEVGFSGATETEGETSARIALEVPARLKMVDAEWAEIVGEHAGDVYAGVDGGGADADGDHLHASDGASETHISRPRMANPTSSKAIAPITI